MESQVNKIYVKVHLFLYVMSFSLILKVNFSSFFRYRNSSVIVQLTARFINLKRSKRWSFILSNTLSTSLKLLSENNSRRVNCKVQQNRNIARKFAALLLKQTGKQRGKKPAHFASNFLLSSSVSFNFLFFFPVHASPYTFQSRKVG